MSPGRTVARRVVIAAGAVLVAGITFAAWLLGTESGARFAAARAAAMVEGLELGEVAGTIAGGLDIASLRFANESVDIEASQVRARLRLRSLLTGPPIRLEEVAAGALTVRLRPGDPDATTEDAGPPNLPALAIDRVALSALRIEPAEGEPLLLDHLRASVALRGATIALDGLDAAGPRGKVAGNVALDLSRTIPLSAAALDVTLVESPERRWQARITATPKRRGLSARAELAAPIEAALRLEHGGGDALAVDLDVPRQSGSVLGLDGEVEARFRVAGSGSDYRLSGAVEAAGERIAFDDARVVRAEDRITIEALELDIRDRGVFAIGGVVPLLDGVEWALAGETEGLVLPRGDGGTLVASGRILVGGTRAEPVLSPALALRADDLPPGALSGSLAIRDGVVHAEALSLTLARGRATLDGPIGATEPHVLRVTLKDLDPGLLVAGWPGRVSGELRFEGRRGEHGFDGEVVLDGLGGELRGRALAGNGALALVAGQPGAGAMVLDAGSARLRLGVDGPGRIDAQLSAPDLADLLPELGGSLEASWRRDIVDHVDLAGEGLSFGDIRIATLSAQGAIGVDGAAPVDLVLEAAGVVSGTRTVDALRVAVEGTRDRHVATATLRGPLEVAARVEGGAVDSGWRGRLATLEVADVARLEAPAALAWDGQALALGEACLAGAVGRACVEATGDAGAGRLSAVLDRLRLGEVQRLAGAGGGVGVDGPFSGRAEFAWRDGRPASGEAVLRSDRGRVRLPDRDDVDLGWEDLAIEATLEGARGTLRGTVRLRPEGELTLDGGFSLGGPDGFAYEVDVDVAVRQLDAIEAFTTVIADPEGDLSGQFKLRGGLAGPPDVSGAVALTGFTAQVPDQAIRVRDGVLVVAGVPDRLIVRGSLRSGDGVLSIDGRIDLADAVPAELVVAGENFRIANSPTMMLVASPDLRLALTQRRWNLDGTVSIPRARIDLERLEGGVAASPDVVVVDDPEPPDPARPWRARVAVELGDDVRLQGFGFDGRLSGRLDVRQRQGARATATGQLDVSGTYRAYGQRLTIREGHLRYAASPLDEPTIDLRAERTVRGQTVALSVTGSALAPTARVVGAPGMSDQDALALLVTGRPLRSTGSADRDALASATSALGVVGGDLLAGKLRGSLGLDELGVSNDTALDGEAFTIGKYLSPRLFVGYGIGLLTRGEVFTVRFLVTDRLDLEASSGQTRRAEVNYRIER